MSKAKTKTLAEMPNLSNATPGFLVDELGNIRDQIKELKKREGFFKQALEARLDPAQDEVDGDVYKATISEVVSERLNTSGIREEMSAEWVKAHSSVSEYRTIRTKKLD